MFKECLELEICMNENIEMKVIAEKNWLKVIGPMWEEIKKICFYLIITCCIYNLVKGLIIKYFNRN